MDKLGRRDKCEEKAGAGAGKIEPPGADGADLVLQNAGGRENMSGVTVATMMQSISRRGCPLSAVFCRGAARSEVASLAATRRSRMPVRPNPFIAGVDGLCEIEIATNCGNIMADSSNSGVGKSIPSIRGHRRTRPSV
jgi:hypothetical protein